MRQIIDYTLLIQTVPELSKRDNTEYTCTIGYSNMLGFIRVYPMPFNRGLKRWNTYKMEVEKNKQDSRPESWKLSGISKADNFTNFNNTVKQIGAFKDADKKYIKREMMRLASPSIGFLNDKRKSLGFICTPNANAFWESNENFKNKNQLTLFQDVQIDSVCKIGKQQNALFSRIIFKDEDGTHNLQLNNWQYYMAQINFRKAGYNLNDAFKYVNDGPQILVLGNLFQHRNIWLVLESFKNQESNGLFL